MKVGLIIDGIMGIVLIFFLYRGLVKGFSGEIIGLVGLFVASFCAWNFLEPAIEVFYRYVPNPEKFDRTIAAIICAVVIFFAVEIIFAIIGFILSYLVSVTQLSFMDHFLGLIVGLVKTCCIALFVYGVLISFSPVLKFDWQTDSYSMKGASYVWPYVRDFMEAHGILDFSQLTGNNGAVR